MACLNLDARALHGLWTSDHWERELSDPDRICIGIAGEAGALLAVASGWIVVDELQITVLAVEPEHRRCGLGRTVLKRLLEEATDAGARRAILDVAEDNHAARALYGDCGFRTIGRRDRYYRDGRHALIQSVEIKRATELT